MKHLQSILVFGLILGLVTVQSFHSLALAQVEESTESDPVSSEPISDAEETDETGEENSTEETDDVTEDVSISDENENVEEDTGGESSTTSTESADTEDQAPDTAEDGEDSEALSTSTKSDTEAEDEDSTESSAENMDESTTTKDTAEDDPMSDDENTDMEQETASSTSTATTTEIEAADDKNAANTTTTTASVLEQENADSDPSEEDTDTVSLTAASSTEDADPAASTTLATSTVSTSTPDESVTASTSAASTTEADLLEAMAVSTSTATSSATTSEATSSTTIVSGQAIALANILNMVNSNFVNSEGVVLFSNFFETVFGAIDFREYFISMMDGYGCSLVACQGQNVAVNIDNNASIDNQIDITATSGNNAIDGAGSATIGTGDAYAGLNLINVANTNLVDSNYLLVTLNAFQDVNGDIVFPSLSQFFGSLAHGASTPQVIDIENTGTIHNNVAVEADAGNNSISNTGSSSIQTGDAHSSTNVFNQLNSSLIGGQSVSVVFRVHGTWAGEIFGAPDNLAWTAGDDGSIYLFDVASPSKNGSLTVHGTSTAEINNNVNVVALTGENAITNSETAVISTGNAYAGANIINVANANVIGRNWILAVINIFGDFDGNIAFGRPDLWVGGQIDVPTSIKNGSELTYDYTIINNGDSPATNVGFSTKLNGDYLNISDSTHQYTFEDGELRWELGTIPEGGAVEISYTATVENTDPATLINSTALVQSRETDNNEDDNSEVLAVTTDAQRGNGIKIELSNGSSKSAEDDEQAETAVLEVSRLTSEAIMNVANRTTEEKLVLRNMTDTIAKNVVLHDILRDPNGEIIRDEVWELGDVLAGEEIELGYYITFSTNAVRGTYTLETQLKGDAIDTTTNNGTIVYEDIGMIADSILASFGLFDTEPIASLSSSPEEEEQTDIVTSPVAPQFNLPLANASENNQLAAAASSGFVLDPLVTILVLLGGLMTLLTFRFFRLV